MEDKRCPNGLLRSKSSDGRMPGDVCRDDGRFVTNSIEIKNMKGGNKMAKINMPIPESKPKRFEVCFSAKDKEKDLQSPCFSSLKKLSGWMAENGQQKSS